MSQFKINIHVNEGYWSSISGPDKDELIRTAEKMVAEGKIKRWIISPLSPVTNSSAGNPQFQSGQHVLGNQAPYDPDSEDMLPMPTYNAGGEVDDEQDDEEEPQPKKGKRKKPDQVTANEGGSFFPSRMVMDVLSDDSGFQETDWDEVYSDISETNQAVANGLQPNEQPVVNDEDGEYSMFPPSVLVR